MDIELYREFDVLTKFGNTVLRKGWCSGCEELSIFDQDKGQLKCCELRYERKPFAIVEIGTPAREKRHALPSWAKKQILEKQDHSCLYCREKFGELIERGRWFSTLKVCWDHFMPYVYGFDNRPDNYVAACQLCNGIKSAIIFETIEAARSYVGAAWRRRGYRKVEVSNVQCG